ncbi:MAG: hypothetical protein ACOX1P_16130 [Thermoguttaceae bacterium]
MRRSEVRSWCFEHAWRLVFAGVTMALVAVPRAAHAQFKELAQSLPRSANSIVILNLEKAKASPMGIREGWKSKFEESFADGVIRVPPQATRLVLTAQLNFETMRPAWEAAALDLNQPLSMSSIAKTYAGQEEKVEGLDAVSLPSGAYAVALRPTTLAAVEPATRQFVSRWLRESSSSAAPALSPYLEKAAGYSDQAGSDIIMAVDLLGAFSMERVRQYLERKEWLKKEHVDLEQLAALLSGLQGIRLGVKIDEQPLGRIAVDFSAETSWTKPFVKRLLLEILADAGMLINDLENWEGDAKGKEIGLQGYFSKDGLRDALCLIQSPAPTINVAESTPASKTPEVDPAAASQQHFGKVVGYLKELMSKKKDIQTFGQHAILFDRYAGRIEKLPILGVDKELIQYSAFVAQQLRNGSQIVRMKGVRTGVQQSNAVVSGSGDVYTYGYVNGWYGDYGYAAYNPRADFRHDMAVRRNIETQEEGSARAQEQQIKNQIQAATNDIRLKMTEKYKVEFAL